ncbi:MAG: aminotransferase class V-fold PLP-dependent enzyme [Planctomycetales bacterium]|nr:aminotransferase class V-fold PLP-dependent enzyme [Planctomycetales bacterium]
MEFLLDPEIAFLNHGSFGACPKAVHDEYQAIQRHLERQPVAFLQRHLPELLLDARSTMAEFVGADRDEIVFTPNPTFAVNAIARSLNLGPGDELLTSNHEYGACSNAWRFMQEKTGFAIVRQSIDLPVNTEDDIVEQIWTGVTENTKAIFLSHISSPTALTIPVEEICRRARHRGITTIIDGAHVPGQMDLDLTKIGADAYVAACHKWLCAPKGSSFMYVSRELQPAIEPLVVGWGWGDSERKFRSGSDFVDYFGWIGTHDPSAYLAVPAAIEFQANHDWPSVQSRCHDLAVHAVELASELPEVKRVHANEFFRQMGLIEISSDSNETLIQQRLIDEFLVEVPVIRWQDRVFIRISVQAYNTQEHIERLITGLHACLRKSA